MEQKCFWIGILSKPCNCFSDSLSYEEVIAHSEIEETLLQAEIMLANEQSRAQCLKEGDRNNNFFHLLPRVKRVRVRIYNLIIDGELTEDCDSVKALWS